MVSKIPMLKYRFSYLLIGLFLYIFPQTCFATSLAPEDLVAARIQNKYDSLKSLSFLFYQNTSGNVAGRPQIGEGRAMFLKSQDGKFMRWDYLAPEKQVLSSDGKVLKMYFESLKQMIVTPAQALESDITYAFFTGEKKLTDDFLILEPQKNIVKSVTESEPSEVIQLVPKQQQSQIQSIHLWVGENDLINRIHMVDYFGTTTILSFSAMEENTIDDNSKSLARFVFEPPAGTEIIEQ